MYIHTEPNRRPVRLHTREWSPNIVMAKNSSHPLLLTSLLVCVWCWSCVVTPSHHCLCVCGDATVKNILHCQLRGRRAHTVTAHGIWIRRVLLLVYIPVTLLVAVWKCIPSIYNKIEVGCKKGWPCHTDINLMRLGYLNKPLSVADLCHPDLRELPLWCLPNKIV